MDLLLVYIAIICSYIVLTWCFYAFAFIIVRFCNPSNWRAVRC